MLPLARTLERNIIIETETCKFSFAIASGVRTFAEDFALDSLRTGQSTALTGQKIEPFFSARWIPPQV